MKHYTQEEAAAIFAEFLNDRGLWFDFKDFIADVYDIDNVEDLGFSSED